MELKLNGGAYAVSPAGGFQTVTGAEELAQRALMRLSARRGGFLPLPEYGSRLHTLCRLKPGERPAAARQYVIEALSDEPQISVGEVEYQPGADGSAVLRVELICAGQNVSASVSV